MIKKHLLSLHEKKEEWEEKLTNRQKRLLDTFKFLLKLTILSIPLYILSAIEWNPIFLRSLNASIVTEILSLLGLNVENTGTFILLEDLTIDVSTDSTAWKSMLAVAALVLATDFKILSKLKGVFIGVLTVFTANLVRISSMAYLVTVYNIDYEFIHTFLWRWGLMSIVFGYWIIWFKLSGENEAL